MHAGFSQKETAWDVFTDDVYDLYGGNMSNVFAAFMQVTPDHLPVNSSVLKK